MVATSAKSLGILALERNNSGVEMPEYYCMCGTGDFGFNIRQRFETYIKENCPNIKVTSEYWSGKHDSYFWDTAIPKALKIFGFSRDEERTNHI